MEIYRTVQLNGHQLQLNGPFTTLHENKAT